MSDHILIERREAIQVIRLNRPEKKNAITRAMYATMAAALKAADSDPAIRVNVILGVPGVFSSGNDVADFLAVAQGEESAVDAFDFLIALVQSQKPVVSGVDGIAVGIGVTINLHCDITFATPETVFRTPFVDLGLVPEAGSSLLVPAILGYQQAFALLALGEGLPAARAKQMGLIYGVVEAGELEERVFAAAGEIAAKPPQALYLARELMRGDRSQLVARIREEGEHFIARLASDEARQAFMAFMMKKSAAARQ